LTWLMTAALGLLLGLCLYGLVRLRNACLPWARGTLGQFGYWVCWLAALALMLLAANVGIILVRQLVGQSVVEVAPLPLEVCFTLVALLTGGSLALRHARNCRSRQSTG
jgi:cytochrome c biogenesis factor